MRLVEVDYATGPAEVYLLADGLDDPRVARALLQQFAGATIRCKAGGSLVFAPTQVLETVQPEALEPVSPLRGEQSNTSIRFGNSLILKVFRRVQSGPNPDVEVGRFLTEQTSFRGTPPVAGSLTYRGADGDEADLALLQRFEPNRGDAWTTTLARIRDVLNGAELSASVSSVAHLGPTTGELHLALSSAADGAFAPEPISEGDLATWRESIRQEVEEAAEALAGRGVRIDQHRLLRRAHGLDNLAGALKTRHHGDFHLGQVLERPDGSFAVIDFEGEPARPLAQRREKRSPLRDVAGLLRSLDYARHSALRAIGSAEHAQVDIVNRWYAAAREAFLSAYIGVIERRPSLVPRELAAPLAALELEKAAYEVLYELNNRPDWLPIPLAALQS
jgi:trehalose synthase-fused probable maltokinase